MDVKLVREKLQLIIEDMDTEALPALFPYQQALKSLIPYLHKKHTRRSPNTSTPMTPELRERITKFMQDCPDVSISDVAATFNVNPARLYE